MATIGSLRFVDGGEYREGILGEITNINPIFATGEADRSVSKLVFRGLLGSDSKGNLYNEMADNWTVDERGVTYTFKIKKDLKWHDGAPFTSQDVVFTFNSIQNIDVKSPLIASWQGVTITAPDSETVIFELSSALATFPQSLTIGIIPKHLFETLPAERFRSSPLNVAKAVGTGPFRLSSVVPRSGSESQKRLSLRPFDGYNGGEPKLDLLIIDTYDTETALLNGYLNNEVLAISGLSSTFVKESIDSGRLSGKDIIDSSSLQVGVYVFMKNTGSLFSDPVVRQALALATSLSELSAIFADPIVPVDGPLLRGQVGYDPKFSQERSNTDKAASILDKAGYLVGADGIRAKNDKKLQFRLMVQEEADYPRVASNLVKQWSKIGVIAEIDQSPAEVVSTAIVRHAYEDAILFGIGIGGDPDVYAFWHSKEASEGGLNLSEYKSAAADSALEAGRSRLNVATRVIKYKSLLENWQKDNPAIALYQPDYIYIRNKKLPDLKQAGTLRLAIDFGMFICGKLTKRLLIKSKNSISVVSINC